MEGMKGYSGVGWCGQGGFMEWFWEGVLAVFLASYLWRLYEDCWLDRTCVLVVAPRGVAVGFG